MLYSFLLTQGILGKCKKKTCQWWFLSYYVNTAHSLAHSKLVIQFKGNKCQAIKIWDHFLLIMAKASLFWLIQCQKLCLINSCILVSQDLVHTSTFWVEVNSQGFSCFTCCSVKYKCILFNKSCQITSHNLIISIHSRNICMKSKIWRFFQMIYTKGGS